MKGCDTVRSKLLGVVGSSYAFLGDAGLWSVYLTTLGYTNGTVLDRAAQAAQAAGIPLDQYMNGEFGGFGPELSPLATSGNWGLVLNGGAAGTVTSDGTGVHFVGAQNVSAATQNGIATVDNATYQVTFTIANLTGGGAKVIVYGNSTLHSGGTANRSANGTYTENVTTTGGGSFNQQIRIQAIGTNGTNTFDITSISVKRVL